MRQSEDPICTLCTFAWGRVWRGWPTECDGWQGHCDRRYEQLHELGWQFTVSEGLDEAYEPFFGMFGLPGTMV